MELEMYFINYGKVLYKKLMTINLLGLIGGTYPAVMKSGKNKQLQIHQNYNLTKSSVITFMELETLLFQGIYFYNSKLNHQSTDKNL